MFHTSTEEILKNPVSMDILALREQHHCRKEGIDFAVIGENWYYLYTFEQLPTSLKEKVEAATTNLLAPFYMWRIVYDDKTFSPVDTSITPYFGKRDDWTDHLPTWSNRKKPS